MIPSFREHQPEDNYVIDNQSRVQYLDNPELSLSNKRKPRHMHMMKPVLPKKVMRAEFENLDDKDKEMLNKSAALLGQCKIYENYEGDLLSMQDNQGGAENMSKIDKIQRAQMNLMKPGSQPF